MLEPEASRACLTFAAGRRRLLGRVVEAPHTTKMEQWPLGRQGQWLARQPFLKQLWERNPISKGRAE